MSNFPNKQFEGIVYTFEHLQPAQLTVLLNADGSATVPMQVTFGSHCFTEDFDNEKHRPDHRYTYKGELRAFDTARYECSLHLPKVLQSLVKGTIYNAHESYTYAAHIALESMNGPQSYSVFFSLEKDRRAELPALRMFIKSAYLKPLVAKPNAQNWRFASLAGQISGVFGPRPKKAKPEKKKAPQGLVSAS
jgi:hypothetical protein